MKETDELLFELDDLLDWTNGSIVNQEDYEGDLKELSFSSISDLKTAKSQDIAFFFSRQFESDLPKTQASILVTAPPFIEPLKRSGLLIWKKAVVIQSPDPYLALARVSQKLEQWILEKKRAKRQVVETVENESNHFEKDRAQTENRLDLSELP